MSDWVRFSFALNARMQAFIDVRDALASLEQARQHQAPLSWLHAASDLRASLLGDLGRKTALGEITALLAAMQAGLMQLAEEHPSLADSIRAACERLEAHLAALQPGLSQAHACLVQDALIANYYNAQKKQDMLGHKRCLPQCLSMFWQAQSQRVECLHQALAPLAEAVETMDRMLNDYVQWQHRTAVEGSDKITPDRQHQYGLLVVGLPAEAVAAGMIPDISGNHLALRIRFQQWLPGQLAADVEEPVDYAYMLVPVA